MKKLLFPLLGILLFTACTKETPPVLVMDDIGSKSAKAKQGKIEVCHKEGNGKSHTITINANALKAHLAHGDALGSCVPTVTICDQVWMVKNLDVTTYRNGDPIPQVTDPSEWIGLTTGAWCYYNNDPSNGAIYGKLYNLYAVKDPRGLAPLGWHVPSRDEWNTLEDCLYLTNQLNAGGAMKSTGTIQAGTGLWQSPNAGGNNLSGFTGFPGGYRDIYFEELGYRGYWWTSTYWPREPYDAAAFHRYLEHNTGILREFFNSPRIGYSVRCVRD